uniref:Pseudouridine synthase I TruA alpha/beta domain-containing protein n=1 Tax=Populus trichocarpa TaxID=3694 RepID=A0A3N7EHA4_POPTR
MDPTVESEIFKALETTRLLIGDRKEIQYSRCGRTDKGVSAVGQVIALYLRSKLKDIDAHNKHSGETVPEEQDGQPEGEIDYVRVLNGVLPKDIRIVGWCPVPSDFSARFSCLSREYKYFFWNDNLNLLVMETAGKKLIGEHDFRNFCKMDAVKVHNYRRNVMSFEISPCDMRFEGHQLYAIKIKGSAFLWHQVRCMVAVLFMIGQGLESPEVIDALLDTRTLRKPQYLMAPEIPLVLLSYAGQALHVHLENECRLYHLQAAIFQEALLSHLPLSIGAENKDSSSNGVTRKKASHVPLMSRETEPSYEERRAKLETVKLRA